MGKAKGFSATAGVPNTIAQTSFNSGEFTPFMAGQTSYQFRASAVAYSQNLIPLKQGPFVRRGGTSFIKEVKDSSKRTTLLEFKFSSSDTYEIEMGDQYFRFFKNRSPVLLSDVTITNVTKANPAVVTYSGADTLANGNEILITGVVGMTQLNDKYYKVANVDTGSNTFELQTIDGVNVDSTNYGTYVSAGVINEVYEISSPYLQADLFDVNGVRQVHFIQSASVMYLFSAKYAPRALARVSNTSWTLTTLTLEDGPYLNINSTSTVMTLSNNSGSVTVTMSSTVGVNNGSGFRSTDVGRAIRYRDSANKWYWLQITAFTNTTTVTATIMNGKTLIHGGGSTFWRLGAFSDTTGWPNTGNFFQERIVLAGSAENPDYWSMSTSGGYTPTTLQFAPSAEDGIVADSNGIFGFLPSRTVNNIQWVIPDSTGCVIGTTGQEWTIKGGGTNSVITPANAQANPVSTTGSAYIQPIATTTGFIFLQSARRKLFSAVYSFDIDKIEPSDITVVAEHITNTGVCDVAYQQEPINNIWSCTTGGLLIGLTYYPKEQVNGFHRHIIGGKSDAEGSPPVVESVSVTPSEDGSRDELYIIVRRLINGVTRRYIEVVERYYESDMDRNTSNFFDSGLVYDGSPTTTVTGLEHLEGETVKVIADSRTRPDVEVVDGSITIPVEASKIVVGLSAPWSFTTLGIVDDSLSGGLGKKKRVLTLAFNLLNTIGLSYSYNNNPADSLDFVPTYTQDITTPLFTGVTPEKSYPGNTDLNGVVSVGSGSGYPATILSMAIKYENYSY